jgi:trehalose/maltose transport system permease protein
MTTALSQARDVADDVAAKQTPVQRRRVRAAWLFLTPMLICLLLVAAWPLLRTFWFSLTDAT